MYGALLIFHQFLSTSKWRMTMWWVATDVRIHYKCIKLLDILDNPRNYVPYLILFMSLSRQHSRTSSDIDLMTLWRDVQCDTRKAPLCHRQRAKVQTSFRIHAACSWDITKTRLFKIYWKFHHQKNWKFSDKKSDIFHISAQNIDCGYLVEPPLWGGSYEYPQSMFLCRNKKNNVYPCKPQFYNIKVGFTGVKII